MILKVPKQSLKDQKNALKRRRAGTVEHCDYLSKPTKNIKRRRTDPVVTFATFLEEVHTELRNMDSQQWYVFYILNLKYIPVMLLHTIIVKEFFRTCNVLPFSCVLIWLGAYLTKDQAKAQWPKNADS